MRRVLLIELNKALRNKWFVIALLAAVCICMASATIQMGWDTQSWGVIDSEFTGLSTLGSYGKWILARWDIAAEIFFLILPLLAIIPYSTSLRTELISGVYGQMVTRSGRGRYLFTKGFAAFSAGFLVAAIPLLVNFVVLSMLCPAYVPEALDNLYFGITPNTLFSGLFFGNPLAFVIVNTLLDGVLCGSWALLVLAFSAIIDNRVVLLAGSFLLTLGARYLNAVVFAAFGVQGFCFNLSELLIAVSNGEPRVLGPLLCVLFLMLGLGVLVLRAWRDGDVL
ncbi:MAG: hypothetical protein PUD09_04275 [Coriobacteriales bacterium]|nr:hypothetical protein [Coriobacteriales bacterium]